MIMTAKHIPLPGTPYYAVPFAVVIYPMKIIVDFHRWFSWDECDDFMITPLSIALCLSARHKY